VRCQFLGVACIPFSATASDENASPSAGPVVAHFVANSAFVGPDHHLLLRTRVPMKPQSDPERRDQFAEDNEGRVCATGRAEHCPDPSRGYPGTSLRCLRFLLFNSLRVIVAAAALLASYRTTAAQSGTVTSWGSIVMPLVDPGTRYTAIAAGDIHSLALKSDGTVVAWGRNNDGQSTVPGGLSTVAAIAAGGYHNLALKSNGTVVAWGDSFFGQSTVPVGLSGVVAIAAGSWHSLALRSDGTVVAWGAGGPGQSGTEHWGQSTVPSDLDSTVAIAAGGSHSLAFRSDGTVVAGGEEHSLALKSDGTVVAWGSNAGPGLVTNIGQSIVPAGLSNVVAIAAGDYYSMAVVALAVESPTLQATLSGKNFILSWPASAQSFSLQGTTNPADPSSWTTLTNVPVIVNEQNTVTDPVVGGQQFYRLKQ
jgi:hypothetical protein